VRRVDALRTVPVVLMSVKADRIGEQFVRHGLADDALSKPFQPAALRAVLEHSLGRPSARAERESELEPGEDTLAAAAPPAADAEEEAARRAEEALDLARTLLLGRLVPAVSRALALGPGEEDEARRAMLAVLGEGTFRDLAPMLEGIHARAGVPTFSGSIEALPLGEVFQMISLQNLTGAMEIEGPGLAARVFLSAGKIDLSRLDGGQGNFRLGNYLVQKDLVSPQEIDHLAEMPDKGGAPLGERLIRLGLISREDLHAALRQQAVDIFYEVLRWTRGVYRFRPRVRTPEATSAALAIPISGLLMEGYRRVDEWRVIEREIRSFDDAFEQNPVAIAELESGTLSTEETLVLDHVNGTATVADIVRALRLDSFEVCRILYRLISMKLIHRRPARDPG
jgi:hypothetical protein